MIDPENLLTIELLVKYSFLYRQNLLHFKFELAKFDPKFSLEKVAVDPLLQVSPRAFFADYEGIYCPQDISVLIDPNQ
jgi:hypothetical protein